MKTDARLLRLHVSDTVLIALDALAAGEAGARDPIPRAHKYAACDMEAGENVLRYGQVIGQATVAIRQGEHVHDHNMAMGDHRQDHRFGSAVQPLPKPAEDRFFQGFLRQNGRVGTRNYLGILTTVNCSGSVARFIAEAAEKEGMLANYPGIDGIVPIAHGTGCGMASGGAAYDLLLRTLKGYAAHPNFGGILIVGLGCEVLQLAALVGDAKISADGPLRYMTIQQSGGTRKTIERGVGSLRDLAILANQAKRTPQPVSKLMLGMQCGGSDGFSGFTANPALGVASDMIVAQGGTTILSETSEIYGAEHLLTRRAVTPEVGQALLDKLTWWEGYCALHGTKMDNNPSPGNKRGGLTTILEKSLGATSKSGQAPLSGVFDYAAPITTPGLVFMDSPGFDPCSVTGQVASGANLIAFTTGRGSVSGYMPVPAIKIASNSEMYARMADDMDLNCGDIAEGASLAGKGREIFDLLIATASGQQTKSEDLGFGGCEFVPWQTGATL